MWVCLAARASVPAPSHHVADVVARSAGDEMSGIEALPVVAGVADVCAWPQQPVQSDPNQPVARAAPDSAQIHRRISLVCIWTRPFHAALFVLALFEDRLNGSCDVRVL